MIGNVQRRRRIMLMVGAAAAGKTQYTFHFGGQSLETHIFTLGTPNGGVQFGGLLRTAFGLTAVRSFTKWNSGASVSDGTTANASDYSIQLRNLGGTGSPLLDVSDTSQIASGNYWWNTQDNHVATGNAADLINTPGPLWRALITDIQANATDGFVWAQGEADETYIGSDPTKNALYKTTLKALFAAVRTATGLTTPIFIHRIGRHEGQTLAVHPGSQNIREIQYACTQELSQCYITAEQYNVKLGVDATIASCTTDGTTGVILTANTGSLSIKDRIQGVGIAYGSFITAISAGVSFTVSKNTTAIGTVTLYHGDSVHPYPSTTDPLDSNGNTTHDVTQGTYDICRRAVNPIYQAIKGTPKAVWGPQITAVTASGGNTFLDLTITHDAGNTLTTVAGAISSLCAPQFYVLNNASQITPTNVQLTSPTNIRLTFGSAINAGSLSVGYAYGPLSQINFKDFIIDNASPYAMPLVPTSANMNSNMAITVTGGTSYVNSVQHVSITIAAGQTTGTASISAVGSLAFIVMQGQSVTDPTAVSFTDNLASVTLTNSTTVTATRNATGSSQTVTINCAVVDATSNLVDSVQFGSVSATTGTSGTAAISSVTTARSAVFYLGNTSTATTATRAMGGVTLTNATTVTANFGNALGANVSLTSFCVVQFAAGAIQSLQQLATASTSTGASEAITISAVVMANTILAYGGMACASSTFTLIRGYLQLTSTTNVNSVRGASNSGSHTPFFTVIEFVPGVISSIERATIAVASATSNTATLSNSLTSKGLANFTGFNTTATASDEMQAKLAKTNATTLTASKNTAGSSTSTVAYEAVNFN